MAGFEDTRKKIRETIKNGTLRIWAIQLANCIEYMSNCHSNSVDEVKGFDERRILEEIKGVGGER